VLIIKFKLTAQPIEGKGLGAIRGNNGDQRRRYQRDRVSERQGIREIGYQRDRVSERLVD
jgi:hypothetical protein